MKETAEIDLTAAPPVPYNEDADPEKFWIKDPADKMLPHNKGFITDFVYFLRGTEIPTLYAIWAALFGLSSMIKREAWLEWFPGWNLYTNFYLILVGGAGRVKKSTTISMIMKVLEGAYGFISDPNMKKVKKLNIIKNKFTPEAMLEMMEQKGSITMMSDDGKAALVDPEGKKVKYQKTSEVIISLPEMSVSINKRDYSQTLIQNLLDLYDPHGTWDYSTRGGGKKILRNLHTTLIAGTTPDGWRDAIPEAATGDGFISRTVVAYQEGTRRRFPKPRPVVNGPTMEELQKRMAWIADNTYGTYALSAEAETYYEWWYNVHRDRIDRNPSQAGIFSRMDNHLLKVAMLMCAQRYSPKRIVTKQDLIDAERVLTMTVIKTPELLENMHIDADYYNKKKRIEDCLMRRGDEGCDRRELLQSTRIPAPLTTVILEHLIQEDLIMIKGATGQKKKHITRNSKEVYVYVGKHGDWYEEGSPEYRRDAWAGADQEGI